MSVLAVITVEGVLAQGDDLRTAQPTKWARVLYDGLRTNFQTLALTSSTDEVAKWWLKREMIWNWGIIQSWSGIRSYEDWRIAMCRQFLADGWEIGFFVDGSHKVCEAVLDMGVPTLEVSYPVNRPGWQPDDGNGPRAWSNVVDTLETALSEGT